MGDQRHAAVACEPQPATGQAAPWRAVSGQVTRPCRATPRQPAPPGGAPRRPRSAPIPRRFDDCHSATSAPVRTAHSSGGTRDRPGLACLPRRRWHARSARETGSRATASRRPAMTARAPGAAPTRRPATRSRRRRPPPRCSASGGTASGWRTGRARPPARNAGRSSAGSSPPGSAAPERRQTPVTSCVPRRGAPGRQRPAPPRARPIPARR